MKYIILCGGIGKRCNEYSLPKPLNYINGKHMIEYIIESIPSNEIYILYNVFLEQYNFEEIVINLFKNKKLYFSKLEYLTRGAVESAYVGIQSFETLTGNIVFIDNDNIHTLPSFPVLSSSFIGYGHEYEKQNYSFIEIKNNTITNIEEKIKISDNYCCGIYGFVDISTFKTYAKLLIEANYKTKNEFYFSHLYKLMIQDNQHIQPIYIEQTDHIGSYDEIFNKYNTLPYNKLRICFDLDNTLVTYPTVPNDYSTVKPIQSAINLLKSLKKRGHEIIIHTARRMKTHHNNVGKVIKDIALVTIQILEKYNIEYDELIFGKPIADIYIDDRSINPYINTIQYFGIQSDTSEFIHSKVLNNKYNTIKKVNNTIYKSGPSKFLNGQLYFYNNIPTAIKDYFPALIDYNKIDDDIRLSLEYIHAIPLYFLFKNKLITPKHIDDLFTILNTIHTTNIPITIDHTHIYNNYFKKLENRFNTIDYPFKDASIVYKKVIDNLSSTYVPSVVGVIHGDFWFSNILLEYTDTYKLVDMKGTVYDTLTLNGDMYYDYGKLYQSILGYDLILNGCTLDNTYITHIQSYFLKKCIDHKLNIEYLTAITHSLIFGTLHSIDSDTSKERVWEFLKGLVYINN